MKVLMVDSERTWRGGEAQVRLLMQGLVAQGVEVALAAARGSAIHTRTSDLSIAHHPVAIRGGLDPAGAWALRGILKRDRYDIIHSHSSHAHSASFLACSGLNDKPAQIVSRRVDFPVAQSFFSGMKYRRGADMYLAISQGVARVLVDGGIPTDRIRIVPSGIDLSKFQGLRRDGSVRREFSIDDHVPIVGNIAALAPHKAQDDFIRAARIVRDQIDDVRFFIVGEGGLRARLEALTDELGLQNEVIFTGFRDDPLEVLSAFDCFAMSSYLEGLGTSIMDAQAMGIPVVATRTGGIPELVENGESGLLVPVRDPESLARSMLTILTDEELRRRCINGGLEKSKGYDFHNTVYKTMDAYQTILAHDNAAPLPGGAVR